MKLYLDGITRNTISPVLIAELKKAGYVEVKEEEKPAEEIKENGEVLSSPKAGKK
jgi:hypothetical protein